MGLANLIGMDIPPISLIAVNDIKNLPAGIGEIQGQSFFIKRFDIFTIDELKHLSAKAKLPEKIVVATTIENIDLFHEYWQKEKTNLPLYTNVTKAIYKHISTIAISKNT